MTLEISYLTLTLQFSRLEQFVSLMIWTSYKKTTGEERSQDLVQPRAPPWTWEGGSECPDTLSSGKHVEYPARSGFER
ncbi:acid phosphatase [Cryptococcus neoformans]|nr:acid phosphatase [Cryptococcus neoformans var. grubii]